MIVFYFLIFILPLSQHHWWGAIASDLTGIKYIGLVCLPYAIFHLARRRTLPVFFATWQARLFIALCFIALVSYLAFGRRAWYLSHSLSYFSFLGFFLITMTVVDSLKRVRWVVLSGIGSIALASAYVVRDWQIYHNIYVDYRPGWIAGDANYFTVDALIFMPVALLLVQQKRPRWQRLFCLGCLAMTLTAVLFSASRGGFIGLMASCLYFLLKSRQRVRNLILVCATITALSLPMHISPVQRLLHPTHSDEEAQNTRLALWSGGWKMIQGHLIFGVGLDNYKFDVGYYVDAAKVLKYETVWRVAHNSYVEIAAELGLPALLIFVGIVISSVRSLERVRQASLKFRDEFLQRVALGLQAGLVGAAVALFFVSGQYQKMFWLAIFLSACLPPLVRSKGERAVAAVPLSPSQGYAIVAKAPGGASSESLQGQEGEGSAVLHENTGRTQFLSPATEP